MPRKSLPSPYRSVITAADDHFCAVRSINAYGEIAHANAVAQEFLKSGAAATEADAVQMSAEELRHTLRISRGEMVNRAAQKALDKRAREKSAERRNNSRTSSALVTSST